MKHRRTGLLVAPGDAEAWSEALSCALEHRAERAMAAAGRADVRQRFELAKVLDQLASHLG